MKQMSVYILIVSILSILNYQDRQGNNKSQSKDCERGREQAKEDIKSKKLGLYFFGLPNARFNLRAQLISDKLKIAVSGGGDVITEEGTCYNDVMMPEIKKKYGEDVFTRIDNTVDSLYAVGKGDREVSYTGDVAALHKFIYCNLNYFNVNATDSLKPSVYVKLTISERGTVEKAEVVKGVSQQFNEEAIRVLSLLKNWIPAIEYSVPAKSRITLRVQFDPAVRNKLGCK